LEKKNSSKSGEFGKLFSWKNPFYWMKSYFSGQNLAKLRNNEILFPTDYLLA
jgi:hypothetical protein